MTIESASAKVAGSGAGIIAVSIFTYFAKIGKMPPVVKHNLTFSLFIIKT